jgi:hypothetical protein
MNFYNDPKNDIISEVQGKSDDLKNVLTENIDKLLDNRLKLDNIVDETVILTDDAKKFKKNSKKLKNMFIARLIFYIIILVMIIMVFFIFKLKCVLSAVGLIVFFSLCGMPFAATPGSFKCWTEPTRPPVNGTSTFVQTFDLYKN